MNQQTSPVAATGSASGPMAQPDRLVFPGQPPERRAHFDIYRADEVPFTSTLSGGGDWRWRLTDPAGAMLVQCGGYQTRRDCLEAVEVLRAQAWSATVAGKCGPDEGKVEAIHAIRIE